MYSSLFLVLFKTFISRSGTIPILNTLFNNNIYICGGNVTIIIHVDSSSPLPLFMLHVILHLQKVGNKIKLQHRSALLWSSPSSPPESGSIFTVILCGSSLFTVPEPPHPSLYMNPAKHTDARAFYADPAHLEK